MAIIGAGISGLTCAYYLSRDHQVTVFESEPEVGGHTATKSVVLDGQSFDIDTGFIVYNDWTYPSFISLLNELGVAGRASEMSFSVTCEDSGLEYAGSNLNTLFADRKNLLKAKYWRMLTDVLRFNRESISDLEKNKIDPQLTLGEYLANGNYGRMFREKYLVPMGAAIWSATIDSMEQFPALFFIRFFKNHGLLSVKNRPQWYTVAGGSKNYLAPLIEPFKNTIRTAVSIKGVYRANDGAQIEFETIEGQLAKEEFDAVIFATHSDQALAMLRDASSVEKSILSSIPYQENEVVLHTDATRLPRRRKAWSSWNYRLSAKSLAENQPLAKLTYNMNILQGIESDHVFCVSLNQTDEIEERAIIGNYTYSHPVFTADGIASQGRWNEISGVNNTWYCGAYWANGFHEDGVVSAKRVVDSVMRHEKLNQGVLARA